MVSVIIRFSAILHVFMSIIFCFLFQITMVTLWFHLLSHCQWPTV